MTEEHTIRRSLLHHPPSRSAYWSPPPEPTHTARCLCGWSAEAIFARLLDEFINAHLAAHGITVQVDPGKPERIK